MKHTTLFYWVALAATFAGNAEAVYKCTTSRGVVYQDRPCQEGNETEVQLTVPTGELAPKATSAPQSAVQGNAPRGETRTGSSKAGRNAANDSLALTMPGTRPAKDGATSEDPQKKDARPAADAATTPMTAEQARKTDPSAKYYTTEPFLTGANVPQQMNCEAPNGEIRRFLLVDGKLSSI